MNAVDPTYPLYPIACIIAAFMLLLVLLTSFVRQSWNLGVAFLCFWLFWENITWAINTIIWHGNADIKLYIYCDIVSRLDLVCFVVKPMSTLIITRRLYLIVNLKSVELPSEAARRGNAIVEWTLGLAIPMLVAGPIYYSVQNSRFMVYQEFGCINSVSHSILTYLLLNTWGVLPALVSILFYYPRVARIFYRQNRDVDKFLRSNDSVSRTNYLRILALASIDVLLTLPMGIMNLLLNVLAALEPTNSLPFYPGWQTVHADWTPTSMTYLQLQACGAWEVAKVYFVHWATPVLAFVIFGLFGFTAEARASYRRILYAVARWFGWKPPSGSRRGRRTTLGSIEFGRPQVFSPDLETGSCSRFIYRLSDVDIEVKHASYPGADIESTFAESPSDTLNGFDDAKSTCTSEFRHAL